MQHNFVGLDDFKQYLGLEASTLSAAEVGRMLAALDAAVGMIEQAAGRRFSPYAATRPQALNPRQPDELLLDADLQVLSGLTDGGGGGSSGEALDLERVEVLYGAVLRLKDGAFSGGQSLRPVSVTGIWGYSNGWRWSGDTSTGSTVSPTDTQINVSDADGSDAHGRAPRFQVGQLLRMRTEYMRVVTVDAANDQITVLRAQNGSLTDGYIASTAIDIFTPPPHVESLVMRVAAWLYHEPDRRTHDGLPPHLWREVFTLQRVGVA